MIYWQSNLRRVLVHAAVMLAMVLATAGTCMLARIDKNNYHIYTRVGQDAERGRMRYITSYSDLAESLAKVQKECTSNRVTSVCATMVLQDNIIYTAGAWQLPITTNINIVGQCLGGKPCSIDGNRQTRHFQVKGANATLVLQNVQVCTRVWFPGVRNPPPQLQNGFASASIGGLGASFGGAIQVTNAARASAINTMFLSNMAGQGGAVAVFGDGSFSAHNSIFEGNTADAGTAFHNAMQGSSA